MIGVVYSCFENPGNVRGNVDNYETQGKENIAFSEWLSLVIGFRDLLFWGGRFYIQLFVFKTEQYLSHPLMRWGNKCLTVALILLIGFDLWMLLHL